jgi:O-antigen/teichoic acid export membrane protein
LFITTEKAFFKNVSFVFGGKIYITILGFFLTPIIARLFEPKDYGEFTLFNTVVQNLVIISTLSLTLAISTVKVKKLEKVFNLTITTIIFFSIVFIWVMYGFNSRLDTFFLTTIFSRYWYILSIGVALSSLIAALSSLNSRMRRFKINASINVTESTSAKFLTLLFGWLNFESLGLILSDVISKFISFFILAIKLPKNIKLKLLSYWEIKSALYQYKSFPLYSMPSAWLGIISNQFIILTVAYLYSKETLGLLSMTIGLLNLPLHLLSNSLQPVITEKLAAIRDGEKSNRFYEKMLLLGLFISTLCFTFIYFIPTYFYDLFLGEKWSGIEEIIRFFCWYYIILFVDQAFQNGFIIFKKQKQKLFFNLIDILFLLLVTFVGVAFLASFKAILIIIIISKIVISTSRVYYLWRVSKIC